MKKRIVSFLMALVMAVSLLPVSALAVDVDTPQDDAPVAETQDVPAAEQQMMKIQRRTPKRNRQIPLTL